MTLIALMMLAADPLAGEMPEIVLLDFTASYCGPCQRMVPVIQELQRQGFPIRKVDTTQYPEITRRYQVNTIPAFVLLVNGQETKRLNGLRSKRELRELMLNAWDRLHPEKAEPEKPAPNEVPVARKQEESKGGLRGVLERIGSAFGGSSNGFEHPTFRAQNTDTSPEVSVDDDIIAATVRVRVQSRDGSKEDVGTGTILHSSDNESIILTCAHLFQDIGKTPSVAIDVFRAGKVLNYPARIVRGDHHSDLAILQVQNRRPLPVVSLASLNQDTPPESAAFSIGCDHGEPPSVLSTKVVELDRYNVNIPSHLVCSVAPKQGRSGGGLYNEAGQLIGVCSCADRKKEEGLYMGRRPILDLFRQAKLAHLLTQQDTEPATFTTQVPEDENVEEREFGDPELIDLLFDDDEPNNNDDVVDAFAVTEPETKEVAVTEPGASFTEMKATSDSRSPVELTVIIGSGGSNHQKEMIVIQEPTPWLLEILTGRSGTKHEVASAQKPGFSDFRRAIVNPSPDLLPQH